MEQDWVGVLEALYEVEAPEASWLLSVARSASACAPEPSPVLAFTYDASAPSRFVVGQPAGSDDETSVLAQTIAGIGAVPVPDAFIDATFRSMRAGSQIEALPRLERLFAEIQTSGTLAEASRAIHSQGVAPDARASSDEELAAASERFRGFTGFADIAVTNGIDTDGHGLCVCTCLRRFERMTAERLDALEHVAAHLSVAWRLRRKLASSARAVTERAEAVLAPDGTVKHAVGTAKEPESLLALSSAARAVDGARTKGRRGDPALGLAEWTGLVAQRWSLVEVFERDGQRFLLAQENELPTREARSLTQRELEVVGLVALGLSNKLVAYELGISPATVGVLLHRAMKKLDVEDRGALRGALRTSA